MSEMMSKRRLQAQEELGVRPVEQEVLAVNKSIAKEEERRNAKERKRMEIEQSKSYSLVKGIATLMDKWGLDGFIGLIPGIGDFATSITVWPFVYVSLFKVRSIPLTLAMLFYTLVDVLIGIIPWVGAIGDFFYRSNLKNFTLIKGFVEDDPEVIKKVNQNAIFMGIAIAILCYLIHLVLSLVADIFGFVAGLFS